GLRYIIHSEKSMAGVAPGQFAVVYDTERRVCLGSGIIS
ncbi:MAG: tRNA 2-thiouridine(34) synthase MnmA, partial [Bacteroidales bacterium]|nr:tRNA 2-thiouridine(34) synthase MnmA [Bacteroidales bacterium]